ncbi:glycosyltransferase [candidate division KSB1 bacterium]|nr:glycosyltransferase [candidate division KSB1 bacterium]
MRGGEKVLEVLCELFPQATLFTLLHRRGAVSPGIEKMRIKESFIRYLPFARGKYRYYLPLFPRAIEGFDLRGFHLIISTSHCVAKGVIPAPHALHISYVHTPMRYVWDMYYHYFGVNKLSPLAGQLVPRMVNYLRQWDVASSDRVHYFLANSQNVRMRIRRHYHREAEVIYPPVNTRAFPLSKRSEDYFLIVSALVPYKRIDLAVEAFNDLGLRLVIVGQGPEKKRLIRRARKNIEFFPWQAEGQLAQFYAGCQALIFPGEEDFGIVPLEAQAVGKPVIAYGRGGVLETVIPHPISLKLGWRGDFPMVNPERATGIFFPEQSAESLMKAVRGFDPYAFVPERIREHAMGFDLSVFKEKIKKFITEKINQGKPYVLST